jgi:hypothetical protein
MVFTQKPSNPLVLFIGKNSTSVEMRWEWYLRGAILASLVIQRYRKDNPASTVKELGSYSVINRIPKVDRSKYTLKGRNTNHGYASFIIKDIMNQGKNNDNTTVDVMGNAVYVYKFEVTLLNMNPPTQRSSVELKVFSKFFLIYLLFFGTLNI